jgi:hypothetical protein
LLARLANAGEEDLPGVFFVQKRIHVVVASVEPTQQTKRRGLKTALRLASHYL